VSAMYAWRNRGSERDFLGFGFSCYRDPGDHSDWKSPLFQTGPFPARLARSFTARARARTCSSACVYPAEESDPFTFVLFRLSISFPSSFSLPLSLSLSLSLSLAPLFARSFCAFRFFSSSLLLSESRYIIDRDSCGIRIRTLQRSMTGQCIGIQPQRSVPTINIYFSSPFSFPFSFSVSVTMAQLLAFSPMHIFRGVRNGERLQSISQLSPKDTKRNCFLAS